MQFLGIMMNFVCGDQVHVYYAHMRTQSYIFAAVIILLILSGVGYAVTMSVQRPSLPTQTTETAITSFEECLAAGNPVMESYPRQCSTKDGKSFTEVIAVPPAPPPATVAADMSDLIVVDTPLPNTTITSPLQIKGKARGTWYFEASFPLELIDANGTQLVIIPVQADGEWMTEDFVPFSATLSWPTSTTPTGTLIFHRDNPSGLPEHDKEIRVPVLLQ